MSQAVPWHGKRGLKGNAATEAARAVEQEYEAARLRLFHEVTSAYVEYWYLSRATSVSERNVELLRRLENIARTKYKTGVVPHSSIIKAQVELGRLEDGLNSLRERRRPLSARLDVLLGRSSSAPLPWPRSIPERNVTLDEDRLTSIALRLNPTLKAAASVVNEHRARVELAGKGYFPDIALGVDYILIDEALDPNAEDSGEDAVAAMIGIKVPVWFGRTRASQREAAARHSAAEKVLANRESELAATLKTAVFEFRDATRRKILYKDTLTPKARQAVEVARQAFEAGNADFLSLIDSQRVLLELELILERARADAAQRLAEIEMLTGGVLRPEEAEQSDPGRE